MAKHLIKQYVFNPGAAGVGNVKIPGKYSLEEILLITNTTNNQIIYNFADPNHSGTTITFTAEDSTDFPKITQLEDGYTTITLATNTTGQTANDRLQIFVEDAKNGTRIRPWPFGTDAIERMRVSNPQSMIDADFEYGLQPTKWAGYGLVRGYPSVYEFPGIDLFVTAITTNGASPNSTITITTNVAHGLSPGQAINITGLSPAIAGFSRADGNFILATASGTSLTYFATGVVGTNGQSLLTDATLLKRGNVYTGAGLNVTSVTSNGANPSVITVNFGSNHGLVPGAPIYVNIGSGTNAALATGPFFVETIPSLTSITYTARTGGAVTSPASPTLYAIAATSVIHRPFDGGVIITCKNPSYGASAVRVSKRYFRYQSGKGLLWSTGTLMRPNYDIQTMFSSGVGVNSTVTCKVDDIDHGLQVGAQICINGVESSGYNGFFTVSGVTDDYTFTFQSTGTLATTTATLGVKSVVTAEGWHGGVVRAGCFDDQNGMFWEYNGSVLSVVRRFATQQLTGTCSINTSSNTVTGLNTRFTSQVRAGDKIVIRGMTHWVTSVTSATQMTVNPDFRGVSNVSGVKATLVQETKIPQSQFNIDTIDGTGPSGYNIDLSKMQMFGIQYTWYGAGFVDFMVRGSDGNWVYAHRIKNNNVNYEAHMRSGNLPVRYSVENDGATTYLTDNPGVSGTTLNVADTSYFPESGTLYIDNELISYTGKTPTTFNTCTRAATLTQYVGGSTRNFTAAAATGHTTGTGIILVSNSCSPTLSHWGSALITDGNFDEDRGYIFNYQRANFAITQNTQTAFLIRLAPSVSNSVIGDLGVRDLLNRSQLLLESCAVTTYRSNIGCGGILVEGVLNPKNFNTATWSALNLEQVGGQPSLAQVATSVSYTAGTFAVPGEQVFAFSAAPNTNERLSLDQLKELTNSPFGGVGAYPNGPDVLAINIRTTQLNSTATVLLRWGEAQA